MIHHNTIIHTIQTCFYLTYYRSPITIRGRLYWLQAHFCTICIQVLFYPCRSLLHSSSHVLPIDQVFRATTMEVPMSVMCITIRSVSLIHIIIAVISQHYRRVMYISQVPLIPLIPSCNRSIIVFIIRRYIVCKFIIQSSRKSSHLYLLRIHGFIIKHSYKSTYIISRTFRQST